MCLIDGDILRYEIGANCQFEDAEGNITPAHMDKVIKKTHDLINKIKEGCGSKKEPILFFTGDTNFRDEIRDDYKANRSGSKKPFHWKNLTAWFFSPAFNSQLVDGLEADDLMSIYQTAHGDGSTIICSRDKDLRITPGWHYGWPTSQQKAFGPVLIDEVGYIEPHLSAAGKIKKIVGGGLAFFYSQCLTGDTVDNIRGLPRWGPTKSFKLLSNISTKEELFSKVKEKYQEVFEENWEEELTTQARLLWMVQEVDDNNKPIMWEIPDGKKD